MRRVCLALLVFALVSCDKLPTAQPTAPQGPAGDVARQVEAVLATNTEVDDRPFEDLLSMVDLATAFGSRADEIASQIRKTRNAAATARTQASLGRGYHLASLSTSVGTFSIPHFAHYFAYVLEPLTAKGGRLQYPFRPFTSTETGESSFTTTNLVVTEVFEADKSKVTGTVKWTYDTITIETQTGATLVHVNDEREMVGQIDVCPDTSGGVLGTIKVNAKIAAQQGTKSTNRTSNGSGEFKGEVNAQAKLTSVKQTSKSDASWKAAAGDGGYGAEASATWNPGSTGFLGGLDVASLRSTVTPRGVTSAAEAARAAGWDTVLDAFALDQSFLKAQELWTHGRCVMVEAPDYTAETPLETFEQEKIQHEETVDVSSETKFSVKLKHRFGGSLSQPIIASLMSGQKTLSPNRLESSGQLTYKAPDEEDKEATVKLQSTSNRGVGTLVLKFETGGGLTLTISGEFTGNATSVIGTVRTLDTVKIGPLEFKPMGTLWQAEGTWTAQTSSFTTVIGSTDTCTGTDSGTITLFATQETRGDKRVWVIDPLDSLSEGKGSTTCTSSLGDQALRGVTIPGTRTYDVGGEAGELFMGTLDAFTVPAEGGSVRVGGTRSVAGGTYTSSGTATAKK